MLSIELQREPTVAAVWARSQRWLSERGWTALFIEQLEPAVALRGPFPPDLPAGWKLRLEDVDGEPKEVDSPSLREWFEAVRKTQITEMADTGPLAASLLPGADAPSDDAGPGVLFPVVTGRRHCGVLLLLCPGLPAAEREALALFACQLGVAIAPHQGAPLPGRGGDELKQFRQLALLFNLTRLGTQVREVGPLVNRLLGEILEALQVDSAAIHLKVEEKLVVSGYRVTPTFPQVPTHHEVTLDDRTLIGKAALLGRTLTVGPDEIPKSTVALAAALGVLHAVATPLFANDQLLGVFSVSRRQARSFTEDELLLVESCAEYMAIAIEYARLFEEERRQVRDLTLMNELGGLVTQNLELGRVFTAGVELLSRITEVKNVFLMQMQSDGLRLKTVASTVEYRGNPPLEILLSDAAVATEAIHSRAPVLVENAATDGRAMTSLVSRYGHRAVLALPLLSEGKSLGVIVLGETEAGRSFSPAKVLRAKTVANQLTSAIVHAQLFDNLKQSYDTLAQTQAELVRHERLAALGELAAVMAHEVRNPLGVIFNSLGSLRRTIERPSVDTSVLLGIVQEEADRLNRIVGDLLDFSRPSQAMLDPVAIGPLIRSALEAARQAAGLEQVNLVAEVPDELPRFVVDAHLMRQALVNLILNAAQSMPRGGTVTVRAQAERVGSASVARIDVSDEGTGISPQISARIFQPFFTTKATGTGLGLAVVKRIIDAHQGEIAIQSDAQGTTFSIRLPGIP